MPIFDVITINHAHLAKVKVIKSEFQNLDINIDDDINDEKIYSSTYPEKKLNYKEWVTYIKKQNLRKDYLSSISVKHDNTEQKRIKDVDVIKLFLHGNGIN